MTKLRLAAALAVGLLVAPSAAQPVSALNTYLGPDGAAYWDAQCRYRGTVAECAAITADIEQLWVDSCPERTAPIPYGPLHIIRYRLQFEPTNQGGASTTRLRSGRPATVRSRNPILSPNQTRSPTHRVPSGPVPSGSRGVRSPTTAGSSPGLARRASGACMASASTAQT